MVRVEAKSKISNPQVKVLVFSLLTQSSTRKQRSRFENNGVVSPLPHTAPRPYPRVICTRKVVWKHAIGRGPMAIRVVGRDLAVVTFLAASAFMSNFLAVLFGPVRTRVSRPGVGKRPENGMYIGARHMPRFQVLRVLGTPCYHRLKSRIGSHWIASAMRGIILCAFASINSVCNDCVMCDAHSASFSFCFVVEVELIGSFILTRRWW